MFFNVPDDLTHLDFANGQCYNASVKENVTFSDQGLPFGLSKNAGGSARAPTSLVLGATLGLVMLLTGAVSF